MYALIYDEHNLDRPMKKVISTHDSRKEAEHSLIAVFLVNRAVKPFLLPVMISFFG